MYGHVYDDISEKQKWTKTELLDFFIHIRRDLLMRENQRIDALAEYLGVEFRNIEAQPAKIVCQKKAPNGKKKD